MRFRAATVALQALQCAMRSRLSHEVAFARIMKGHSQKWSSLPPEEQEACERRAETLRQDRRQQRSEASEEIQQQLEALVRRADQEQQPEGIRIPSPSCPHLTSQGCRNERRGLLCKAATTCYSFSLELRSPCRAPTTAR